MCNTTNKTGISFALGALVGTGVGFFLATKKGRKYLKEAWQKVEPYIDEVQDEFDEVKVKSRDVVEDALTSVKDFAEDVEGKAFASIKKPIKRTFFKGV